MTKHFQDYSVTIMKPPIGRHEMFNVLLVFIFTSDVLKSLSMFPSLMIEHLQLPFKPRCSNGKQMSRFSFVPFIPDMYQRLPFLRARTMSVPGYPDSSFVSSHEAGKWFKNSLTSLGSK